ncbi:MAG: class I SAM-dependent methyltransferase [Planctomycetaceae bacterium]|nr:class I SAM-dependent methyltransferase [Planctomycetaceae bacterium]
MFESFDRLYGYPDSFPICQCQKCTHIFLAGEFSEAMLTDLYSNYYPRGILNPDDYQEYTEHKGFLSWLDGEYSQAYLYVPPNVRVLDIGCGFCESLIYHKKRGCEVYGVDADENIKVIAERHKLNFHVGLFESKNYEKDFFDYITLDQSLEHVVSPLDTLKDIEKILKPGGKAIISVPNAFGLGRTFFGKLWFFWGTPFHLQFFNKKSMQIIAERANLKLKSVKYITKGNWLLGELAFLLVHKPRGIRSDYVQIKGKVSREVQERLSVKIYQLVEKLRLAAWIMKAADCLHFGDNIVFILEKPA